MIKVKNLKCGIRMVLEEIPYVQSVSLGIWVRAGARDESRELSGVSHFIEHMMFKGTEKRTAKEIAEDTDRISGQMNAFTGKEATCYYIKTLSSNAESAAEILSDMFMHSKFDKKEMAREKKVIYEEMKMVNDSPEDVAHDTICELVFKNNPLAKSILGTQSSLRGISRDMLKKYIEDEYTKDSVVVAVSGNFDEDAVCAVFEKELGGLKDKKLLKAYEEAPYKPSYKVIVKDIEQSHICLGTRGVKIDDDLYYALSLLSNIFGGTMSSRLFQNIREQKGLAYSVYSHMSSFSDMGYFNIYAGVAHNKIEAALLGIKGEISSLKNNFVTEDELSMAKEQLKGNYIFGQENINSRMFSAGKNMLILGRTFTMEEVIEEIDSVTMDEIRAAAEIISDISNYSAVIVTNEKINLKRIMSGL
ncbi:MAG: peptidase M16 [Eubacteriales Family XIII. Incertae Sedis bacterium]|nr:MAG: peptidase M16 [Clostridiales Family XIII bacterium]